MSAPSDGDVYSYAKFLVELFPDDAVEILCERTPCDVIKLVEQRVNRACIRLGGGSKNSVKGMVENRQWDELKVLQNSPAASATTPRGYHRTSTGQTLPPTPSSTASGSPQSRRIPSYDWIIVYHTEDPVRLMASPSGIEEYLIGEDKLERFHGLSVDWITPPKRLSLGGKIIEVAQNVHLTWNRSGDTATQYKQFWVVRPDLIRHADVLLGYKEHQSRDRHDKAVSSPLSLISQASQIPPPAPTPPQHQGLYQATSSAAIYSLQNSPTHGFSQASNHNDMTVQSHHSLRSSGRTVSMHSGPPSLNSLPPSQTPSVMGVSLPRPQSASSTKTTSSFRLDTVLVQLSFKHHGRKLLHLDLTMNGDQIIPFLEPHISRMGGTPLDRDVHEIEITSLKGDDSESQSSSLSEDGFDDFWAAMVEFIRENRASGASKKPEFQLDIG